MPTPSSSEDKAAEHLKLLEAMISLALSAWMVWQVMVPKHAKQLLAMRCLKTAQKITGRLAYLTGAASMGAELASGQEPDGAYLIPHGLSTVRDWLGRAYDRARGITP